MKTQANYSIKNTKQKDYCTLGLKPRSRQDLEPKFSLDKFCRNYFLSEMTIKKEKGSKKDEIFRLVDYICV